MKISNWSIDESELAALLSRADLITRYDNDDQDDEEYNVAFGPVGIIGIKGVISRQDPYADCHLEEKEMMLRDFAENPNIKNIVLYFNSPGGELIGVPEYAQLINKVSQVKPVYAYSDTYMLSAAYWLASQADYIYVSPTARVGGIGVFAVIQDYTQYYEKEGIKFNVFYQGKYKLLGAPFKSLTEEEQKMIQERVDNDYNLFTAACNDKRRISAEYMQGQTFTGIEAVKYGLADGVIDSFYDFIKIIKNNLTKSERLV